MNLFINSPSYYTKEFGIIEEIYKMCQYISHNIDVKEYSNDIDTIGISPIIAPISVIKHNNLKEVKYVSVSYRMANIALFIDYTLFIKGTLDEKKQMILSNILKSLDVVSLKLKSRFNCEKMKLDVMESIRGRFCD